MLPLLPTVRFFLKCRQYHWYLVGTASTLPVSSGVSFNEPRRLWLAVVGGDLVVKTLRYTSLP